LLVLSSASVGEVGLKRLPPLSLLCLLLLVLAPSVFIGQYLADTGGASVDGLNLDLVVGGRGEDIFFSIFFLLLWRRGRG